MKATHHINIDGKWYSAGDELPEPTVMAEQTEIATETVPEAEAEVKPARSRSRARKAE